MEIIHHKNPITDIAQGQRLIFEICRDMPNMRSAVKKKAKARIEKIEQEIKQLTATKKPTIEQLDELIQGEGCEQKCNEYRDQQIRLIKNWLIEDNIQSIIDMVRAGRTDDLRAWLEPVFEHDCDKMDEDSLHALYRSMKS